MKKIISIIIITIISILFFLFVISPKQNFSENENRYLQKYMNPTFSNIINGEYTTKLDSFITDHYPFREKFLSLKTKILKITSNKISNLYIGKDGYLLEERNKPENKEKITNIINKFALNNKGKNIEMILVPTSTYIYKEKLPSLSKNYSEQKIIDYYKSNLNLKFIDITDKLINNKDKDIYYKTDHHWNMKGSYIAYKEFCRYNKIEYKNYNIYEVNNNFRGTYYKKILDDSLEYDSIYNTKINSNYIITNKNEKVLLFDNKWLKKKDKYNYYLDGNHDLLNIKNFDLINENKLLIIKDSYANNFIPFLIDHYSEIDVIDPRYYKDSINKYIEENNYTNILLLYNVGTLDSDLGIRTINRQ